MPESGALPFADQPEPVAVAAPPPPPAAVKSTPVEISIEHLRRFALDPDYWLDSRMGRAVIADHVANVVAHFDESKGAAGFIRQGNCATIGSTPRDAETPPGPVSDRIQLDQQEPC